MAKKKDLSILFIGNSHTYYNDMPLMVKQRAEDLFFCDEHPVLFSDCFTIVQAV